MNRNHEVGEEYVLVGSIKPSPENDELYGAVDLQDNDLVNLANDIVENGIREAIVISTDGQIVSGHRRYAAATLAGLETVPVRRLDIKRSDHTKTEWKRILRAYNHQRVKSAAVRMNEALLELDPDVAHQQLIEQREERDRDSVKEMSIRGNASRSCISDRKQPMLDAANSVIESLKRFWPLSVRQIHYGLLNDPPLRNVKRSDSTYANDRKSYGDLCDLLTRARIAGKVSWKAISDETRPTSGLYYSSGADQFLDAQTYHFLRKYRRDLMQSQPDHLEVVAEKMTVQTIISQVTAKYCIPTTIGRGYCSLDPRKQIAERYWRSGKDRLTLIICSDFDPDGEEIANSLACSLRDDFGVDDIRPIKAMLTADQVDSWELPANEMEAKSGSKNYTKFVQRFGSKVFELEALSPDLMQEQLANTIENVLDISAFNAEIELEKQDAAKLGAIKTTVVETLVEMGVDCE